jgi:hypothetical protein
MGEIHTLTTLDLLPRHSHAAKRGHNSRYDPNFFGDGLRSEKKASRSSKRRGSSWWTMIAIENRGVGDHGMSAPTLRLCTGALVH